MPATDDSSLALPRILCLHGGGVTGDVFRLQARALIQAFKSRFRFVFVDAPFLCDAGPGISPSTTTTVLSGAGFAGSPNTLKSTPGLSSMRFNTKLRARRWQMQAQDRLWG